MRKAPAVLLSAAVPLLSVLPVVTPPAPAPRPVATELRTVAVSGVDPAALASRAGRPPPAAAAAAPAGPVMGTSETGLARADLAPRRAPGAPEVLSAEAATGAFRLAGVSWARTAVPTELTVLVRTRTEGRWGGWTPLETGEPADGTAAGGARDGTEPYWAGRSDGVQVRVDVRRGVLPRDLRVDLVDPGESRADGDVGRAPASTAAAAVARPAILTRAEWGADESKRNAAPTYMSTIRAGIVHHTAGSNSYTASDVPAIIRGIYAYETDGLGYSDIAYSFIVDKWGRTWEGRAGGVDRPVKASHAGGFNAETFGIGTLGNYDTVAVPTAVVTANARLLAWKLGLHGRDPMGTTVLTSDGRYGTSRYAAGTRVTVNTVAPHREVGFTACPGRYWADRAYTDLMPQIRTKAAAIVAAATPTPVTVSPVPAALVDPTRSAASAAYGTSTPLTVRAGVATAQTWRLDVRDACRGTVVRTLSGNATRTSGVAAVWDLRTATGERARPGRYALALTSAALAGAPASWSGGFDVLAPPPTAPPAAVPTVGGAGFVALPTATRVLDTRRGTVLPPGAGGRVDVRVLGVGGVPSTGVTAVALNVTATCPVGGTVTSVWPAGSPRPATSSLNLPAGTTRAAMVVSAVGGDGRVSIAPSRATDVLVDVMGYYTTAPASRFHAVPAGRVHDTRSAGRPLGTGETLTVTMPSRGGVAGSAMTAAVANVTVLPTSTSSGYVSVHPAGVAPRTSSVSWKDGQAISNRAVTRLTEGRFSVTNRGAAAHVVVDVAGWHAPATAPGGLRYTPVPQRRVLDTRSGAPLAAGAPRTLAVTGAGRTVPADAKAVVMTLTATESAVARAAGASTTAGSVTAWPAGGARPGTTDLLTAAGDNRANLAVVRVGAGGAVALGTDTGTTHLVADVVGYYR